MPAIVCCAINVKTSRQRAVEGNILLNKQPVIAIVLLHIGGSGRGCKKLARHHY